MIEEYNSFDFYKTDKKYILNDDDRDYLIYDEGINSGYAYCDYCFFKDDYLEVVLHQKNGYIDDYRSVNLIEKELRKYRK